MGKLRGSLSDQLFASDREKSKKTELDRPSKKVEAKIPAADAVGGADTSIKKNLPIKEIDPKRCKPWPHHNRNSLWLTKERSGSLVESIRKDGQKQLGLVRKLDNDPDYDYEIIYGVRRWFSCSQIEGRKFRAEVTNQDDAVCARLMHLENEESENITEFEKACSFKEQLDSGLFKTKGELADTLSVSNGLVTRLIKAAEILNYPKVYELLKHDVLNISIRGASSLVECLNDKDKRNRIERMAIKIAKEPGEVSVKKVIKDLLKAAEEKPLVKDRTYITHGKKVLLSAKKNAAGKVSINIDPSLEKNYADKAPDMIREAIEKMIGDMY